jgi:hypothetical protein
MNAIAHYTKSSGQLLVLLCVTSTLVSICLQDQKQVHMLLNLVMCVSIAGGAKNLPLYI